MLYTVHGTGYEVHGVQGTGVVHGYLVEDVRGTAINLSPGLFINCCPRLRLLICKTTHPLPPSYSVQSDTQCCNRVDVLSFLFLKKKYIFDTTSAIENVLQ